MNSYIWRANGVIPHGDFEAARTPDLPWRIPERDLNACHRFYKNRFSGTLLPTKHAAHRRTGRMEAAASLHFETPGAVLHQCKSKGPLPGLAARTIHAADDV